MLPKKVLEFMIFLRILHYFYYLCAPTLLVRKSYDQQKDPEPDGTEQSFLVLVNVVFISCLGKVGTNLTLSIFC